MATELMQTSKASTTTFKDEALELEVFILNEESLCKIFESV
jgi:hypothetical protein